MVDSNKVVPRPFTTVDAAFWIFVACVALLPVGLGGNRPIPLGLAQAGFAVTCILAFLSPELWKNTRFFKRLGWALLLFAAVLVWALLQIQPFVPDSWKHPLWHEAAAVLTVPVHGSISIVPEEGLKGITRLITYLVAGILAYLFAQESRRAALLVKVLWLSGAALCFYGLVVHVLDFHTILWIQKWAYIDDLTATFVNHNHFAIYAGMVLVCGVSLLYRSWLTDVQRQKQYQRAAAMRIWLVRQGLPQLFLIGVVILSIVYSHSRAGLFLAVAGLGGYFFFYQLYMKAWLRAAIAGLLAVIILALAMAAAIHTSDRFAALFTDYSSMDRVHVYKLGLRALMDNPWLGYGLNGFEPEFRLYQQNMIMEFNHAHSDILESVIDLGIPGAALLWCAVALLLSGLVHGIRFRRQNGIFPVLALTTSIMVLAHATVDFSLQIPGVAIFWAALLGTGLGQSWKQAERKSSQSAGGELR